MKKNILITLGLLLTSSAFAKTDSLSATLKDSKAIYQALSVDEQVMAANRMQLKYKKSVGGLTCIKTDRINTEIKYECSLEVVKAEPIKKDCVEFEDYCRAAYCTGGYKLVSGDEVLGVFRYYDYGTAAGGECELQSH